jgi:hypothetical protein
MNNMKKLDIVLIILSVFLFLFITANLVIFCVYGAIPDTLVSCVLGASGVELVMTAAIKIFQRKDNGEENEEYEFEEAPEEIHIGFDINNIEEDEEEIEE